MTVPDFMPVLARGKHSDPSVGACIMEYVSYLAGEEFSDKPGCVDINLAGFARAINDILPDEERQALLPFISRLMGTYPDYQVRQAWYQATVGPKNSYEEFWRAVCVEIGMERQFEKEDFEIQQYLLTGYVGIIDRFSEVLDAFEKVSGITPKPLSTKDIESMKTLAGMKI